VIFASIMFAADWSTATGFAGFRVNFFGPLMPLPGPLAAQE
jgi:hypothetical protein